MDLNRFDGLTRELNSAPTRRDVARALAGFAVGGVIGTARFAEAGAKKCGPCRRRKRGKCRGKKPDDAPCNGDGRCLNGHCNERPSCLPAGEPCEVVSSQCCSGSALPICLCDTGKAGRPCTRDGDCESNDCVGYVCR